VTADVGDSSPGEGTPSVREEKNLTKLEAHKMECFL